MGTRRLDKQRVQALGLTEEWMKRAKLALEKGDEEAARAALERKNQQEEQVRTNPICSPHPNQHVCGKHVLEIA